MTALKKREEEMEGGKKGEEEGTLALAPQKPSPHSTPSERKLVSENSSPFRGKTTMPQAQQ